MRQTTDGGITFNFSSVIPIPPDMEKLADTNPEMACGETRVNAFTPAVIGIEWECRSYASYEYFKYFSLSTDAGHTWGTSTPAGNEYFLDAQHGWRLLPSGELQTTYSLGPGRVTIKIVSWKSAQFDFVDPFEGWALVSNGKDTGLVHTINGGWIWDEIKPVISPEYSNETFCLLKNPCPCAIIKSIIHPSELVEKEKKICPHQES